MSDANPAERVTFSAKNPQRDVFKEVDLRAREKQSHDVKLSYRDAVHMVCRADEDLHRLYLSTTPPLHHN